MLHLPAYILRVFCTFFCSTSEECKASTCSSTLEAYNKALLHSLSKLITIFNKIDSHIRILGSASKFKKASKLVEKSIVIDCTSSTRHHSKAASLYITG